MAILTKTVRTVVASGTVTAGTPLRGSKALASAMGGVLTAKITNGGTGPTTQCTCTIYMAHDVSGVDPATGAAGTVWKLYCGPFGAGISANGVWESGAIPIEWGTGAIQVEFSGNTGANVTAESILTEVTAAS